MQLLKLDSVMLAILGRTRWHPPSLPSLQFSQMHLRRLACEVRYATDGSGKGVTDSRGSKWLLRGAICM